MKTSNILNSKLKKSAISFCLIYFSLIAFNLAFAEIYSFSCKDSQVAGSIKYGVIGTYSFDFKDCSGLITYDSKQGLIKSVQLSLETKSLHSNCPSCDKIVLSKRLLDAKNYPLISYDSQSFIKTPLQYLVEGTIHVRGVSKKQKSSFMSVTKDANHLDIKGSWLIRRKDFNIIWSKVLDHGGVLVGEHIRLNWHVLAHKDNKNL